MARHSARSRGLTRFELGLIFTAICAIGGGIWLFTGQEAERDERAEAEQIAAQLQRAVQDWQNENSRGCPTLTRLERDAALKTKLEDPWGNRFRVSCSDEGIRVFSPGRDGRLGTPDDIESRG